MWLLARLGDSLRTKARLLALTASGPRLWRPLFWRSTGTWASILTTSWTGKPIQRLYTKRGWEVSCRNDGDTLITQSWWAQHTAVVCWRWVGAGNTVNNRLNTVIRKGGSVIHCKMDTSEAVVERRTLNTLCTIYRTDPLQRGQKAVSHSLFCFYRYSNFAWNKIRLIKNTTDESFTLSSVIPTKIKTKTNKQQKIRLDINRSELQCLSEGSVNGYIFKK